MLFFFVFILLSLERIAILHVKMDKASNAYCLVTLINTRCYCNKQKNWLNYWFRWNENDKTGIFDRFFFNYKLWLTLTLCGSSNTNSLWLFKLCGKRWLTFCVANITMPTSFHQSLGVKPCFETKFCQTFPYKIHFFVCEKFWLKVQLLWFMWLTENLGVISTLENIRTTEMDNY